MKNSEREIRMALKAGIISGLAGFSNGVFIILAGTSYFFIFSPYSLILGALFLVFPGRVVDLFRSGVQFILAPLLGALLGVWIGYAASRRKFARPLFIFSGTASGAIGGFFSLGIVFLNVYAS